MILKKEQDQLKETYLTCELHVERMKYAYEKIAVYFPLNVEQYNNIEPDTISFFDQLIYRFSKLQDVMGSKLFKALLACLGEDVHALPMIDVISKSESFKILDHADDWYKLREIRNVLAHEYPLHPQDIIDGLNLFHNNFHTILQIWETTENFIFNKFGYLVR